MGINLLQVLDKKTLRGRLGKQVQIWADRIFSNWLLVDFFSLFNLTFSIINFKLNFQFKNIKKQCEFCERAWHWRTTSKWNLHRSYGLITAKSSQTKSTFKLR